MPFNSFDLDIQIDDFIPPVDESETANLYEFQLEYDDYIRFCENQDNSYSVDCPF